MPLPPNTTITITQKIELNLSSWSIRNSIPYEKSEEHVIQYFETWMVERVEELRHLLETPEDTQL